MPYTTIPGTNVKQRPASEAFADPDLIIETLPDGTLQVRRKPGFWTKALPYIIGGGMGYGALANAGILPGLGGAASGGGSAASAGPFTTINAAGLPVTPGLAGAGAPIAPGVTGAGIAGTAAGGAANVAGAVGGGKSLLDQILKYAPLGFAGAAAAKGFMQPRPPAEDQLANILRLAESRATAAQPLFENLLRMTNAQLPKYARGEQ